VYLCCGHGNFVSLRLVRVHVVPRGEVREPALARVAAATGVGRRVMTVIPRHRVAVNPMSAEANHTLVASALARRSREFYGQLVQPLPDPTELCVGYAHS